MSRWRGQPIVAHRCERVAAAGVEPGTALAHARALLGNALVAVYPHEPGRDLAALRTLGRWAMRFSPIVAVDPPDGLLLDIAGCAHLFGGERSMLRQLLDAVRRRLGFAARAAVAPTVGCAWAVARYGEDASTVIEPAGVEEAMRPLPVRALRIDPDVEAALASVAVDRIGDLLALPRDQLAARFGEGLLLRLDQALGHAFEPVEPLRPREPIYVQREFAGPVKQLEAIERATQQLLAELSTALEQRERGVRRLVLAMERIDAANLDAALTLSRPTRDATHLWRLLQPRLERMNLGWGVQRLTLHAVRTARLPHEQGRQWSDDNADGSNANREIGELVDLLTDRFGPERVSQVEAVETHVPERCFVRRPALSATASAKEATLTPADRPSLLYPRPEPVRVMLLAPDGPVLSITWRGRRGETRRVVTTIGPERITPRWWLTRDAARSPPPRDYFKLQDEAGRWWWVYRSLGTGRWFLHGEWA